MFDLLLEVIRHYSLNIAIMVGSIILAFILMFNLIVAISVSDFELSGEKTLFPVSVAALKKITGTAFVLFPLFVFDYWAWVFVACSLISFTFLSTCSKSLKEHGFKGNGELRLPLHCSAVAEAIPYFIVSILAYQWIESGAVLQVLQDHPGLSRTSGAIIMIYSALIGLRGLYKVLCTPFTILFENRMVITRTLEDD